MDGTYDRYINIISHVQGKKMPEHLTTLACKYIYSICAHTCIFVEGLSQVNH